MEINSTPIFNSLEDALKNLFSANVKVVNSSPVFGGDINKAYKLQLSDNSLLFMKTNEIRPLSFFAAEAVSLNAIASSGVIRTPKVLAIGSDNSKGKIFNFLLLMYINSAPKAKNYWEDFAINLAALHQAKTDNFVNSNNSDETTAHFGFLENNFIGLTPQINRPTKSWVTFFRDCRLAPQFKLASSYFSLEEHKKIEKLLTNLESYLVEPEKPSLLHGDLWSGNVICDENGKAMLIDPACYVGHHEVDLAMTKLFGGFPNKFYKAYQEAFKLQPGFEARQDLYNLYHLLNHLNLFGASYLADVKAVIKKYVG